MTTLEKKKERLALAMMNKNYSADVIFRGVGGYHAAQRNANAAKIASKSSFRVGIELEVVANSLDDKAAIGEPPSNWIIRERDGSLPSAGVEFVTIPLRAEDAASPKFWKPFCEAVSSFAKSWKQSCTGLHVHVGKEIFAAEDEAAEAGKTHCSAVWAKIFGENSLASARKRTDEFLTSVFGRCRAYQEQDMLGKIGKAVDVIGDNSVYRLCEKRIKAEIRDYAGKYNPVNICPRATIEFRLGKGSISATRIAGIAEFCVLFCKYCNRTPLWKADFEACKTWIIRHAKKNGGLFQLLTNFDA